MLQSKKRKKLTKFDLLIHLIIKVNKDDIFALASQQAYYLILAFFPFVISLASLVGYINIGANEILAGLLNVVPENIYELTKSIIEEVVSSESTGVFSISLLVSLWMSSAGFRGVIKGINKAYNFVDNRSYIKRTAIALLSTIVFALTIILVLVILVFGKVLTEHIIAIVHYNKLVTNIWIILRYVFMVFILFFVFSAIYRYIPVKRLKWKEVFPGALVSAVGWFVLSMGFSFYIENFNNYSKFYGSLATVFILMLWIFLISIILIFGVEVNSVLYENKRDYF